MALFGKIFIFCDFETDSFGFSMIIDGKLCATTELNQAVVDWALPSREIQMHKGKRKHCNQKSFSRYEFTIHEESKTKGKPFKRAAHLFSRSLSSSI